MGFAPTTFRLTFPFTQVMDFWVTTFGAGADCVVLCVVAAADADGDGVGDGAGAGVTGFA